MIGLLIADDHAIVRKGMKQILAESCLDVFVGEADNAETFVKKIGERQWDIAICDVNMPGRNGLEALKQVKQSFPELPVLVMSLYPADQYALRALRAGAAGYIGKDSLHEDLVNAVKTVLKGKKFITPSIADTLLNDLDTTAGHPEHAVLSDREFEVMKLLASGATVSEISNRLCLSSTTVSTYRARVLRKMGMRSNAELARYAFEAGLIV